MHKSICCDPLSEPSRRDGSDEGSQHKVSILNKENYHSITIEYSFLSSWLVGCFGLNGPLRQYFSLYRAISQRERERKEK